MNFENIIIKSESFADEEYCNFVEKSPSPENVEHPKDKLSKCGVCGHRTTSDILLKLHMKMHFMRRVHQCSVCKKTFNFITELNVHMLNHKNNGQDEGNVANSNHVVDSHRDPTLKKSGGVQTDETTKKFKNNPNSPMNTEEKLTLLQYVEEMELNTKYVEMESLKGYLRKSWIKMSELFAEKEFDRSPEKLARTYIHMKNQAKLHIERFYKHKKLPRPRQVDYLFVKLCPADFEAIGLDIHEILEDFRIFDNGNHLPIESEIISQTSEDKKNIQDVPDLIIPEERKTELPDDSETPSKIPRLDPGAESCPKDYEAVKMEFLLAEEQRRKLLYAAELSQKDELFAMEMQHRRELHQKSV